MISESVNSRVYTDFNGLANLKASAREESPEAIKQVAKEFESTFVEMMLKSLRDASSGDGLMENDGSRMYQDMFDKQIAVDISERGDFGVAKVIEAQLTKDQGKKDSTPEKTHQMPTVEAGVEGFGPSTQTTDNYNYSSVLNSGTIRSAFTSAQIAEQQKVQQKTQKKVETAAVTPIIDLNKSSLQNNTSSIYEQVKQQQETRQAIANVTSVAKPAVVAGYERSKFNSPEEFIETMRPHAERAAEQIGVSPDLLIAQAALETGWGKKVIKNSDGSNSHNLFGIKASHAWEGDSVNVGSLEYRDGVAKKEVSAFRSYPSFTESFDDYVDFIKNQSRYEGAVENADDSKAYIKGLQQAGYATDPNYANKVMNILERKSLQGAWKGNA